MRIYHYNRESGELIGLGEADEDPLEQGNFLIPAWATVIEPVEGQVGKAVVFDGAAWGLKDDHRGQTAWLDGVPVIVNWIGPIGEEYSLEPPPPVPMSISDRQFAQGLAHREIITKPEAIAWAARGDLPAALSDFLASLSEQERFDAEITMSSATEFRRDHPLVTVISARQGMTPADIDEFWRYCATL